MATVEKRTQKNIPRLVGMLSGVIHANLGMYKMTISSILLLSFPIQERVWEFVNNEPAG